MTDEQFEKIELYLSGEMEASASAAFEQELQANKELADTLALYKMMHDDLQSATQSSAQKAALQQNLQQLNQKYFFEEGASAETKPGAAKVVSMGSNRRWMRAIAAILVLAAGIWAVQYFFFGKKPADATSLYAQYAVHEPLSATRGSETDTLRAKAIALFNKKEYAAAIPLMQQYMQQHTNDNEWRIALGIAYMETGQYDQALMFFDSVANGASALQYRGKWYMALMQLKQGRKAECLNVLKTLPNDAPEYKQAEKLIQALAE
jgi:tetratricopeptide (TPR) repeat protein